MPNSAQKRAARLFSALLCLAIFAILAALVHSGWTPLLDLDKAVGRWPEAFTSQHRWAYQLWAALAVLTGTMVETFIVIVIAIWLVAKNYDRAAIWTIGVMTTSALVTSVAKNYFARERPTWDQPLQVLNSYSFPSGHSSAIAALMSVAIVLELMLVRKRGLRRTLVVAAVLFALLVGADRIFLGVHNLSDVIAGFALGAGIALAWLVFFDPTPKSIIEVHQPLPHPNPSALSGVVGVVLNPIKVEDPDQFKALVESLATQAGYREVKWWLTTVEDTGFAMARAAREEGADVVIAVGGDGTIRAVCEELAGSGIPVGIVPAGTGNLLARNLDLPLYLRQAVDVALNGQDRAIDMVKLSGDDLEDGIFLVMAGMGFDAAIMEGVNEDFKDRVGWLAYVWSALKSIMFPAIWVEVSVDGAEPTRHRARTVVLGNVGYLQAGLPLLPDAALDDGKVDLVLIYPHHFLAWLPLAARILTQSERNDDLLTRMSGSSIVVRADHKAPRQIDGDPVKPGREIRAESLHGILLVRVPR